MRIPLVLESWSQALGEGIWQKRNTRQEATRSDERTLDSRGGQIIEEWYQRKEVIAIHGIIKWDKLICQG